MFEPGTKVVCINDSFVTGILDIYNALPRKGQLYTVRDIVPAWDFGLNEQPAVYLVELVNRPNMHGFEPGFKCFRFVEPEDLTEEQREEYAIPAGEELVTVP